MTDFLESVLKTYRKQIYWEINWQAKRLWAWNGLSMVVWQWHSLVPPVALYRLGWYISQSQDLPGGDNGGGERQLREGREGSHTVSIERLLHWRKCHYSLYVWFKYGLNIKWQRMEVRKEERKEVIGFGSSRQRINSRYREGRTFNPSSSQKPHLLSHKEIENQFFRLHGHVIVCCVQEGENVSDVHHHEWRDNIGPGDTPGGDPAYRYRN